jgi:tetratricopeptide (TPR) repeat protein
MSMANQALAPDDAMTALIQRVGKDVRKGMKELDGLLVDFPNDPRLHFLKGSLLAGNEDYEGARLAMRRAVDIAPNYAVARFQLGFLLLTSGDAIAAQEAWGPLHGLPADNYIRRFVDGLCHLIRDEFDDAIHGLQEGIARNQENAPMNRDMQLIIDEIRERGLKPDGAMSSVDFLLQQSALRRKN